MTHAERQTSRQERLWLSQLRLVFQARENLIEQTVQKYMQQIADGQPLKPIMVRFDGKSYFLQDGFHRVEAARRCGTRKLDAEIAPGTLEDMEREFTEMLEQFKADLGKGMD